jgi:aryl-alcohol dehydrogenase-like predicted oxidoreductase
MKYNKPKRIDFNISEISFGAWQLGNQNDFYEMKEKDAINLVQTAVKNGITLFDTAPNYGGGQSEILLGKALKGVRDKVFINSKFGHHAGGRMSFAVEDLEPSIQSSLTRLQTDYLDSVILHNPGQEMLYGSHEIYREMKRLKEMGLIHYYGVSVDTKEELEIVLTQNKVDVVEVMFNIIHQSPKVWFDEIKRQGILLMIKVPFDSGWLTGKYTKDTKFRGIRSRWSPEVIDTRLKIVEKVKDIVGENIIQSSLRFILDFDAVTCVIPGTRNLEQLNSNIQASDFELNQEKHHALESLYESYIKNLDTPW